ncbi:MAG: cysteine desulfurase [Proteobacteria bacterium]|nr:cysteine desulfurase [Pseudomonadota bacterium]
MIYFDHNATTGIDPRVHQEMYSMGTNPANPSSVHQYGRQAKQTVEAARNSLRQVLDAHDDCEVIFTASGTEANNIAIHSLAAQGKLTSTTEHQSVLGPIGEAKLGVDHNGILKLDVLEHHLKTLDESGGILVSVMLANNETGVIQPIREIADIAHHYGAILHTDAVQAVGKIPVSMRELGVDMLSCSSHKIGGPAGVGALLMRRGLPISKGLMQGGGQEYRLRPGSHNVCGIHGFAVALALAPERVEQHAQVKLLRDHLEDSILKAHSSAEVVARNSTRLPNTSSIIMPGIKAEVQVIHFDLNGIATSAGSACSSGKVSVPYVHMSMGYSEKEAEAALRVSLAPGNSIDEVDRFVSAWGEIYSKSKDLKLT